MKKKAHLKKICFLFLTLFFHFLLLYIPLIAPPKPTPIEVKTLSLKELHDIKKQWDKNLLIGPQKDSSENKKVPSRFFSDKNRSYKKEQLAQKQDTIPSEGKKKFPIHQMGIDLFGNRTYQEPHQPSDQENTPFLAQTIIDDSLAKGSEQLLNTEESIYYSFFSRIYSKIAPLWKQKVSSYQYSAHPGMYLTQIEFILDKKGNITDVFLIKSSGHQGFDSAAIECWHIAQAFPNPPKDLMNEKQEFRKSITFQVSIQGY
jgi:TonB family protein